MVIDRGESLGQVDEDGCTVDLSVMILFRTLSVAEVDPWWDSKWSVICLLTWLSNTLERQGRMDIGL